MDECPRCGSTDITSDIDCGPDSWDDDIYYHSEKCNQCGLWHDGWDDKFYIDVDNWRETEYAEEYVVTKD